MDPGLALDLRSARPGMTAVIDAKSNALHRERDGLAATDAQRGKRALAADLVELVRGGHRDARARHAQRVTQRNGAAVRIDVLGIVGKTELAHAGETLRGERLVQFDHVEV